MNLTIANYNMDRHTNEEIEKLPWNDNEEFEGNLFFVLMKIHHETELNYMVLKRGDRVIIYVTKYNHFSQR